MAKGNSTIPYGFCQCGCGQKTPLAKITRNERNQRRGEPVQYVPGHAHQGNPIMGRKMNTQGYILIYQPYHPRAGIRDGYVREHILIAEKVLGKYLPNGAQIHHPNGKQDNSLIVICENQSYHHLLHVRTRALREAGDVHWRKCNLCKKWDTPDNLYISNNLVYHRSCHREAERIRYQNKHQKG